MRAPIAGLTAAAALITASLMATPATAMPVDNLTAAAQEQSAATRQNVQYICGPYRCWSRPAYYTPVYVAPRAYYAPRVYYGYGPGFYGAGWYGGWGGWGYRRIGWGGYRLVVTRVRFTPPCDVTLTRSRSLCYPPRDLDRAGG